MKVKVSNIEWDTSDFTEEEELASGCCVPDLPSEIEVEVEDENFDEDDIVDHLSDEYGYYIVGYTLEY